jgi:hypothetical protein
MSRQFFSAVAILALVLIALTVVIAIEPVPLRSMPLPQLTSPTKYQFATYLHHDGLLQNIPAIVETDGTTIRLAYFLAVDIEDSTSYLNDPEWIIAGGNLIYTKYIESDQHTHIVMLDASAIPPYGTDDYPVDGVEYLLNQNISPVQITPNDGLKHFEPVFSDANSKIAYLASAENQWSDIYTINLDGTGITQVTNTPDVRERDIAWSPDGTMLAYTADVGETAHIFVVSANGGEPTQVTSGPSERYAPVWSGSGERLFYAVNRLGSGLAWIQSMSLSGKDVFTHYTAIPDTAGAVAFIDSLAFSAHENVLAFIEGEQLYSKGPDLFPQYTNTLHLLNLNSGQLTSPAWDGAEQPMMIGLAWRPIVPGVEPPLY